MKNLKNQFIFIIILLGLFALNKLFNYYNTANQQSTTETLEILKKTIFDIQNVYHSHPITFILSFSTLFLISIICYIPFIATFFCLVAGFVLPFLSGLIYFCLLVAFSYTCSFLISKFFLQKNIQKRMGHKAKSIQKGFEENGTIYLMSLRLSGVVPGSLLNAAMGVTNISTWRFYIASQIGILPHAIATFYMGSQISYIKDLNSLMSDKLFFVIFIISLLPLFFQTIFEKIQKNCKNLC